MIDGSTASDVAFQVRVCVPADRFEAFVTLGRLGRDHGEALRVRRALVDGRRRHWTADDLADDSGEQAVDCSTLIPTADESKLIESPGLIHTSVPPVDTGQLWSSTPVTANVAVSAPGW